MYQDNAKARRVQASEQDLEMALQMFYEERNAFFRPQRSTQWVFRIKGKVGLQEQGTFKVILLSFYFYGFWFYMLKW